MDATLIYDLLQQACRLLETANEHHVAAHVSQAMALIQARYGVGRDDLEVI